MWMLLATIVLAFLVVSVVGLKHSSNAPISFKQKIVEKIVNYGEIHEHTLSHTFTTLLAHFVCSLICSYKAAH